MMKAEFDHIKEAFACSRTEYKTILFVCIILIIITILFRFGPMLHSARPIPSGTSDTLFMPVPKDKPLTLKEMDRLGIP